MKKFSLVVAILIAMSVIFSFTACDTVENGITIKYATMSLSFVDEDGAERNEDVVIKIYTNYAPKASERVIQLAKDGFYKDTVVNNVQSTWFTVGGYKFENDLFNKVSSNKGELKGEFYNNGLSGNKLTVSKGSVLMYRDFGSDINPSPYNTADCQLIICTDATATFPASDYCIIGKIEDADQLDVLADVIALRDSTDDNDEVSYNRYYAGGIDTIAKSFLNADGTLNTAKADEAEIDIEDIVNVSEGGAQYHAVGFMDAETYEGFSDIAMKFINAIDANSNEYFFFAPYETIKVTGVKITDRI